jgi:hypothetical protein
MSKSARAAVATRMAGEIHEYLTKTLFRGRAVPVEVWEQMKEADIAVTAAMSAWERGEIAYDELEAAGTRYVEAWERVNSSATPPPPP